METSMETVKMPINLTRNHYVYLAKLAENSERYVDMANFMLKLVDSVASSSELTVEERNLLSVAYKNSIGELRASWRIVSSIQMKEECREKKEQLILAKGYKSKVESQLTQACFIMLKRLDSILLPSASNAEAKVFFLKMKGDYYRYLAEFKVGDERKQASDDSMASYKAAQAITMAEMSPAHPLRLGVELNISVFHFEILNSREKACSIAKQAFDEAIVELDNIGDESYNESTLIMQLIRDNLSIWSDSSIWDKDPRELFNQPSPIQMDA